LEQFVVALQLATCSWLQQF